MTDKLSEARLQLFQSDKLASLGRLAAGVAHEINNPLTGVLTYSSFLLKRTQDQPEIQEDLKVIVRETLRSREIVKSLLDFARQSIPKKNEADLNEIIDRAIAVVHNQITLGHVTLVKNLDPGASPSDARREPDPAGLHQSPRQWHRRDERNGRRTITIGTSVQKLSPVGMAQLKKATCPKRHSLIDATMRIEGLPAVRVKIRATGEDGFLYVDPLYGRHRDQTSWPIAAGQIRQVSCPECSTSLIEPDVTCPLCGAPAYWLEIPTLGKWEACTRQGCDWQRWEAMDTGGLRDYAEITVSDTGCGIPVRRVAEDLRTVLLDQGTERAPDSDCPSSGGSSTITTAPSRSRVN